ncbi:enoyl-CoA hydratase/isomerase family protein [Thalassotalea sp. LPB0316]|uniref:enoyl-CoA hydratase-related protein n=1 Tax=Thalassotalea sp. LPB0316 TaxID=2769490 RepID=UPI001867CB86|nr:enoyl-CoA hydratase-related protein [Thalassotalea sp. LPB0316]QOL25299.1 enoyl-CoA hydratase/isomerase family protein [Thalassotalea sp. LPB0316]
MKPLPKLSDATLTLANNIATLTLNRHDVRNALTGTALIDDLAATAQWINCEQSIAVLIITGQGSAFSAGGNIKDMANQAGDFGGDVKILMDKYRQGIQKIPLAMQSIEVPIIAAVNGPAIGAGFDLANMCDLRIASSKAKFGETFSSLGLIPGDGGAWFLQRIIGYQQAAELTFTGRVIEADEAKSLGIVLEVVEPERLLTRANQLAEQIAANPTMAMRMTKRLMKMAQRMELPDFLSMCAAFQGMCHHDQAHLEAVEAMLAKISK